MTSVNPSKTSQEPSIAARCLLFLIVVGVSVAIYIGNSNSQHDLPAVSSAAATGKTSAMNPESPLESAVRRAVEEAIGVGDSRLPRLKSLELTEQVGGEDVGSYLANIEFRVAQNLTAGLTRAGLGQDLMRIANTIFVDSDLEKVGIVLLRPVMLTIDDKGHEREMQIGKLLLRRKVLKDVEWKNLDRRRFEDLAKRVGQLNLPLG